MILSLRHSRYTPTILALLAATCFGASTPFAKLLLRNIDPILLAALLYLGSGAGLALYQSFLRVFRLSAPTEAALIPHNIPWLIGATLTGGIMAPILLMISLQHTPAATATLLLNFIGVATTVIAILVFREQIAIRIWWAILMITLACIVLTLNLHDAWGISPGAVGVLGACVLWGLDNNITRQIAEKDPHTIVMLKGLCAGSVSLIIALLLHKRLPGLVPSMQVMALGSIGYGASMVFFILAMRQLGAARTSGYFTTAPFMGVLFSFILLRDNITMQYFLAVPILIIGVIMLAQESHFHEHRYDPDQHEHRHRHDDDHHAHEHADGETISPDTDHTHLHLHSALQHVHQHTPDLHHRHHH